MIGGGGQKDYGMGVCGNKLQIYKLFQVLTITIKLPYMVTYVCWNFGICDTLVEIPKSIYQASYLLPSDFPNNCFYARSYLNRMKKIANLTETNIEVRFKKNPHLNPKNIFQKIYCLKTMYSFVCRHWLILIHPE